MQRLRGHMGRLALGAALVGLAPGLAAASPALASYRRQVRPVLARHCFECHADGAERGKVAFDAFPSEDALTEQRDLWARVLKNVRAGLMPPHGRPRLPAARVRALETWIKRDALGIDPRDPDPGRVTLRRLNRIEYRNTIRDLVGYDFKVEDELPPDDTGYGFDNIGDVLSVSPMLLEKYMKAAETIADAAVPRVPHVVAERTIPRAAFRGAEGGPLAERHSFYQPAAVENSVDLAQPGRYRVTLALDVGGQFDFDPGRMRVALAIDGRDAIAKELAWQNNKPFRYDVEQDLDKGTHRLSLALTPLVPAEQRKNDIVLRVSGVELRGPLDEERWVRPKHFELFFTGDTPEGDEPRHAYATEVLTRFATRAFRRPVDRPTVERLVALAESVYRQPGKRFEDGIAQAIVPVLASPRFLFRTEDVRPDGRSAHPQVDEWALASRLSYFLWSTMPDEELFRLAREGRLRQNLRAQVGRMLADPRAQALVENFTGQWLQTRDVEGIDINARAVLARDAGQERELERMRRQFREEQAKAAQEKKPLTPEQEAERERLRERRRAFFRNVIELDRELRRAMREETERTVAHVVHDDRSVLELLDADYTFLNERLAKHYGIPGVTGPEMRLVKLPADSPRGGVLTHASVLVVTSNPTRTSPVKRGLFVLDNVLGIPPPPPPPDVPPLEDSDKPSGDHEPTLREILAIHRDKPLCKSCHARMDPLGLALENFNALGMWRDKERGQAIDAAGQLITGETFTDVRQVKRVLVKDHRRDFYRCLTEKLLTYALGRGVEYYDVGAVDDIVARLEKDRGRFSTLLTSIIESAPFQKRRSTP